MSLVGVVVVELVVVMMVGEWFATMGLVGVIVGVHGVVDEVVGQVVGVTVVVGVKVVCVVALAASAAPSGVFVVLLVGAGTQNRSAPTPHHLPCDACGWLVGWRVTQACVDGVVPRVVGVRLDALGIQQRSAPAPTHLPSLEWS